MKKKVSVLLGLLGLLVLLSFKAPAYAGPNDEVPEVDSIPPIIIEVE